MSIKLQHAININGSCEKVYKALTDINEMAKWHNGAVEGEISVGAVMKLNPKPGLNFSWETKELVDKESVVQTCVEGPGSSVGKTLSFSLSDLGGGKTLVKLTDGDWSEDDEHLPFCNTYWGKVLNTLKQYVES